MAMIIDTKPLLIECISSFIRYYVAEKRNGSAGIMPLTDFKLHVTITFGMAGCDLIIDLEDYEEMEPAMIFKILAKEIEQKIG